ncbi:MAG: PQQ-binding-like beta-propeller repeat protein, partial [Chromatiaceae bacterium]|nr:PQQ-binding-like beta-propeller repeat protein [Chromatiaceae bacterium]
MSIPAGTSYKDATLGWTMAASDISVSADESVAIAYFPATFYLSATTPLPEGFGFDPSAAIPDGLAPDGSTLVRYEIRPENFTSTEAYTAAINNFANWFTYYRKRHIATRGAIGMAFKDFQGFRIGHYTINSIPGTATDLVFRDLSDSAQRTAFFKEVYEKIASGGTYNRQAVNHMRTQFARTDSGAPITEECQMNFGILFTDGYSNPFDPNIGNRDGDMGSPYADSVEDTMADIGAALYLDNPRPDLTPLGRVPTPTGCSLATPPAGLDCNTNLHVNLFGVTMGAPGLTFNVDLDATADPFSHPPTWPTSFAQRNPVQVDDLWHATLNSRGLLLSVEVPSQLGARFADILANIAARLETSATSAATSSAVLQSDTRLYRAGFRSDDWSGSFTAHAINVDGSIGALAWDAEDELVSLGAASRRLFTRAADTVGSGSGAAFAWGSLTTAQQAALNHNVSETNDGLGSDRLDWLRGDENANSAFRDREGRLLGDIINSDPLYHEGVLYVGANDGMLHAFDADSGEELFAYIPSELLRPDADHQHAPLSRLSEPDYAHRYFMDGTVAIAQANLGGTTKTVLVGSTGLGGRTLFALDVSDPTSFDETHVLWEFSDPALGLGSGPPFIGQLADGTWAVLLGNGYNSATESAALIAVSLDTGALLKVLDTGSGDATTPNGLGPITVTDWPV